MFNLYRNLSRFINPIQRHNKSRNGFNNVLQNFKSIKFNTTMATNVPSVTATKSVKVVGFWLAGMAGMTWGAVLLGGLTRLTESGLSMVNWHLFKELPPLSNSEWLRNFELYKEYPEYEHVVKERGEMSLSEFKFIWYMEYFHRMWGRTIGATFLFPAIYFYKKGYLDKGMKKRVGLLGTLILCQGLLGWYMVKSGLEKPISYDENPGVPRVSHFRLSAHLSSAAVIYSLFLWSSFTHLCNHPKVPKFEGLKKLKILGHSTKAIMFSTLIFGAFVAGLDAGLTYNSWPKMADRWIPSDLVVPNYGGFFSNLVLNPTGVQFTHRMLAYSTCGLASILWFTTMGLGVARTGVRIRNGAHFVLGATFLQSTIGILALVNYVPITLASLHQNTSLVLLSSLLWFTHCLKYVPK